MSPADRAPGLGPAFDDGLIGSQIWLLDDDRALCRLLERILNSMGWRPRSFHRPNDLLAALDGGPPDLVVLDQMLPDKPGTHLLAHLRQAGWRFPVLMLSALGAPADRICGLEMGADDYLAKPFLPRELQLRIEKLLQLHPRRRQAQRLEGSFWMGRIQFEPAQCRLTGADGIQHAISRGAVALLLAFCQAPDQVLSRDHLLLASGSLVDASTSRSLDVRLSRLRRLLESISQGTVRIETVRGLGYRLHLDLPPCR
ncbi:MAG: response regulator transcription factor [Cyanobium sp.]